MPSLGYAPSMVRVPWPLCSHTRPSVSQSCVHFWVCICAAACVTTGAEVLPTLLSCACVPTYLSGSVSCLCMHACVSLCTNACIYMYLCLRVPECKPYMCQHTHLCICLCVCAQLCRSVKTRLCVHACLCLVCTLLCMSVCEHLCPHQYACLCAFLSTSLL